MTSYYVIEQQGDKIFVSHLPKWLFYCADKQKFFEKRRIAYEKLAGIVQDDNFWKSAKGVMSRSITIGFERETDHAGQVKTNLFDRLGLLFLWFANVYNWRPSRLFKICRYLSKQCVSKFQMDRDTFVAHYLTK